MVLKGFKVIESVSHSSIYTNIIENTNRIGEVSSQLSIGRLSVRRTSQVSNQSSACASTALALALAHSRFSSDKEGSLRSHAGGKWRWCWSEEQSPARLSPGLPGSPFVFIYLPPSTSLRPAAIFRQECGLFPLSTFRRLCCRLGAPAGLRSGDRRRLGHSSGRQSRAPRESIRGMSAGPCSVARLQRASWP
ncbi:hypothetical protein E2C01_091201 [Portunus trituberculatus]|uniref:Uncharacterized protein n=1 Tax=Portunus trituberculatus TaxID=210409 RepID=A0A5B7JDD1_PORTR|nr:hypothetical protein [Portunus trituberculatus]